jgi:NADH:ubiquinone reductase (non-electrogenic)
MASTAKALTKLPFRAQSPAVARLLSQTPRRSITTRPTLGSRQTLVARQLRRGYADEAAPIPTPKKPRRFRVWRWSWRLLNISILGGIAYVGYGIYQDRHPAPQIEPDPSKKTLVILGKPGRARCKPF